MSCWIRRMLPQSQELLQIVGLKWRFSQSEVWFTAADKKILKKNHLYSLLTIIYKWKMCFLRSVKQILICTHYSPFASFSTSAMIRKGMKQSIKLPTSIRVVITDLLTLFSLPWWARILARVGLGFLDLTLELWNFREAGRPVGWEASGKRENA